MSYSLALPGTGGGFASLAPRSKDDFIQALSSMIPTRVTPELQVAIQGGAAFLGGAAAGLLGEQNKLGPFRMTESAGAASLAMGVMATDPDVKAAWFAAGTGLLTPGLARVGEEFGQKLRQTWDASRAGAAAAAAAPAAKK